MKILAFLSVADSFLLNKFEEFAHWFQKLTGKDNFWLSKFCLFFLLFFIINAFYRKGDIKTCLFLLWIISKEFKQIISVEIDMRPGFENQAKVELSLERIIYLFVITPVFVFLAGLTNDLHYFYNVSYVLFAYVTGYYFMSCTPLPPCKSKIKQWVESAKERVKSLIPSSAPASVSVFSN